MLDAEVMSTVTLRPLGVGSGPHMALKGLPAQLKALLCPLSLSSKTLLREEREDSTLQIYLGATKQLTPKKKGFRRQTKQAEILILQTEEVIRFEVRRMTK